MKKLILAKRAILLSLGMFALIESSSQESVDPDKPKYYKLAQTGPTTYCCVESTNSLDTCSRIPC
ncbi:hypothetical protein [Algoriphagus mannitolivorans]|uniref:hypothetical protein n=1 Tax=Algoriphagus mannitolivorans TaxID=226504 RepID=UPI0012F8B77F|nr:hypothetical protein [Algoriphagus mannitolivorans]